MKKNFKNTSDLELLKEMKRQKILIVKNKINKIINKMFKRKKNMKKKKNMIITVIDIII